ncbi:helix-turn-helix transcriptional regulator [Pseudomonas sp. NPDC086278]|uniref:helix-turn-helix transcriptional regulator n=1 Tax=Pseudomonas sp. NPDC086278 TaxID=3390646 RepID=UPI003D002673
MAEAASLSPMYFAAQFKATTGYRPRSYLLICRIDRAKILLCDSDMPIIEIAIEVGFRTQAHFTTVFKRVTAFTPNNWRWIARRSVPQQAML